MVGIFRIGSNTYKEFWKKKFRWEEASFFGRVSHLRPYISPNSNSPTRGALCTDKKVAVTLYYLRDCGTLSATINSFEIATNTASAGINEVCNAIVLYVGPKYLHLPKRNQEVKEKISEFETKFGMIHAFGCIDGTHTSIACPPEHSHDYFCYKQFHSLSVQAACIIKVLLWILNVNFLTT